MSQTSPVAAAISHFGRADCVNDPLSNRGRPRWNNHALPAALGCRGWFTAKVATLGELDAAMARAAKGESASYIEVVAGPLDLPAGLAMAHQRLDALYGNG
jgi:TPP-dependent 2-oxoacid decarboxylase